jgi:hypothetical protein
MSLAIADLQRREHPVKKTFPVPLDGLAQARDFRDIHSDSNNHGEGILTQNGAQV